MNATTIDLDRLEALARIADADFVDSSHFSTKTVLELIALARLAATQQAVAPAGQPFAYLKFRAAQRITTEGDVDANEWYEVCQAHEIGDDKLPAFPVYDRAPAGQPEGEAPQAEAFAWAVLAENGNVIIWSKNRSHVEPVAKQYGRPVVPVIALPAAQHAESGAPAARQSDQDFTYNFMVKRNAALAAQSQIAQAAAPCEHKRQATTALGAVTGTGWTCKDCGTLISEHEAPDRASPVAAAPVVAEPVAQSQDALEEALMNALVEQTNLTTDGIDDTVPRLVAAIPAAALPYKIVPTEGIDPALYAAPVAQQSEAGATAEDLSIPDGPIDANMLEQIAKDRPDECFLKGSGIIKLIGAIRELEAKNRALAASQPTEAGAPTAAIGVPYWRDALRRSGADTDYHGRIAFTVKQFQAFVSELTPTSGRESAAPAAPTDLPAFDPVVEANRKLLLERSHVGMKKYGTTLAAAGLSPTQLARHALEEALDLANYLQTIIQTEEKQHV